MADFAVNLSGPQAAGAGAVAPVQEHVVGRDFGIVSGIVDTFAKGLAQSRKDDAEARKQAVIGEYVNNQKVYTDALTTGQWNASQSAMASRANYAKIYAAYPEYGTELANARREFIEGTELSEAQKTLDREVALREKVKGEATSQGYQFYSGMSKESEDKTLDAFASGQQMKAQVEAQYKASAEKRAIRGEVRSESDWQYKIEQQDLKETARKGLVTLADKNLGALSAALTDLMGDPSKPFEEKMMIHAGNVNRIKQGLLTIASTNPEMAAPWQKLVDDIDATAQKMLDPKAKAEGEAATLKAQFDSLMYTAKLSTLQQNPGLVKYVVGSQLFNDPSLFTLAGSADIKGWLDGAGSGDPTHKPAPMVGTPNEKPALKTLESAINNLNSGKVTDKVKASQEAVNASNEVMRQTTAIDSSIGPQALKDLSAFYSSTAFGSLAASGKIDMGTMQNVKKVFQVAYEPAIQTAVLNRLNSNVSATEKVIDSVNIKFSGSGVVFEPKALPTQPTGRGFSGGTTRALEISAGRGDLKEAQQGLNTLIKMGAHLSGTTDYAKFWEENKHLLMPGYFMEGVKEGTLRNGYKFLGGDARNPKNWEQQASGQQ